MKRFRNVIGVVALGCLFLSCGNDPQTYNVQMDAQLVARQGEVHFVTPAASVVGHPADDIVGKPYMIATYPAGFSPGNDLPIEQVWGAVPEDLSIKFVGNGNYSDGPYDIVLAIYIVTEVPRDLMTPEGMPPAPVQGDLATFTIDQSVVREGDPTIMPGLLRINVAQADGYVQAENRIPSNPGEPGSINAALTNTIMIIP